MENKKANIGKLVKHKIFRTPKASTHQDFDPPEGAPMLGGDFGNEIK